MDPRSSLPEPPQAVDDGVTDPHDDGEQARIDLEYVRDHTPLVEKRQSQASSRN